MGNNAPYNLTLLDKLNRRGYASAAALMGWKADEKGQGWQYPVYGLNGQITGRRWKNADSKGNPKSLWIAGKSNTAPYYAPPGLPDAIRVAGGVVYMVEGEPDVLTLVEVERPNVFSPSSGTSTPMPNLAHDLMQLGVVRVIQVCDNDTAGLKFAAKVRDLLSDSGIEHVAIVLPTKDSNDYWQVVAFDRAAFLDKLINPQIAELPARYNVTPRRDTKPLRKEFSDSTSLIVKIKGQLDIVDRIGRDISLKKAGNNFKGIAPWRTEKTPSLVIYPDSQSWCDFGDDSTGDIITYVERRDSVDRAEAVRLLAAEIGIHYERNREPRRSRAESGINDNVQDSSESGVYTINPSEVRTANLAEVEQSPLRESVTRQEVDHELITSLYAAGFDDFEERAEWEPTLEEYALFELDATIKPVKPVIEYPTSSESAAAPIRFWLDLIIAIQKAADQSTRKWWDKVVSLMRLNDIMASAGYLPGQAFTAADAIAATQGYDGFSRKTVYNVLSREISLCNFRNEIKIGFSKYHCESYTMPDLRALAGALGVSLNDSLSDLLPDANLFDNGTYKAAVIVLPSLYEVAAALHHTTPEQSTAPETALKIPLAQVSKHLAGERTRVKKDKSTGEEYSVKVPAISTSSISRSCTYLKQAGLLDWIPGKVERPIGLDEIMDIDRLKAQKKAIRESGATGCLRVWRTGETGERIPILSSGCEWEWNDDLANWKRKLDSNGEVIRKAKTNRLPIEYSAVMNLIDKKRKNKITDQEVNVFFTLEVKSANKYWFPDLAQSSRSANPSIRRLAFATLPDFSAAAAD